MDPTVTSTYNTFGVKVSPVSSIQSAGLSTLDSVVDNSISPANIASGNMVSQVGLVDGFLQSSNFETGSMGWQINSDGDVEFNSGVFRGALQANSIDIPDTSTTASFHTDNLGNSWWGATTFAAAPAKIDNTGAATFNSATIAGYVITSKGAFGGDGSDGALTLTSGTTNYDLGGATTFTKNWTSISVTGTAAITFTNPNANGTIVIFKSQGNVTVTSSATRAFDLRSLGATQHERGNTNAIAATNNGTNAGAPTAGALGARLIATVTTVKNVHLACGSGGSGVGNSATPVGGRGGGCLYIECRGAWNVSSTFDASGQAGTVGGPQNNGAGGGGAGGGLVARYNSVTSDTATYTVTGGTGGGNGGGTGGVGGNGGAGYTDIAQNTDFA